MKIGYPCINLTLGCRGNHTFRLKSYTDQRLVSTVDSNLECLLEILRFNAEHSLFFFRITSDLVPFASHPVCRFNWQGYFRDKFEAIGEYIRSRGIRISMHPDQFTLLNSRDYGVFERSLSELVYHAEVLDLMHLDTTAKIQIHVGGLYGDRHESRRRFIDRFRELPDPVRRRLVIENDDRNYTLADCLDIHDETGIPVLFDSFHHELNSSGETVTEAFNRFCPTWGRDDGVPMVDYSQQLPGGRRGAHAAAIDTGRFREFLGETRPHDFDIMLEIKDKEFSAMKAANAARGDNRSR